MSEKLDDYKVMELVKGFQIATRDVDRLVKELSAANAKLETAEGELVQHIQDDMPIICKTLDGNQIMYFVRDGYLCQQVGRVLRGQQ